MFSHRRNAFDSEEVSHQIGILRRGRHPDFPTKLTPQAAALQRRALRGEEIDVPSSPEGADSSAPQVTPSSIPVPSGIEIGETLPASVYWARQRARETRSRSPSPEWVPRRRHSPSPERTPYRAPPNRRFFAAPAPSVQARARARIQDPAADVPLANFSVMIPPEEHTDVEYNATHVRHVLVEADQIEQAHAQLPVPVLARSPEPDEEAEFVPRTVFGKYRADQLIDYISGNMDSKDWTVAGGLAALRTRLEAQDMDDVERIFIVSDLVSPEAAAFVAINLLHNETIARVINESFIMEEAARHREEALPECPICADHKEKLFRTSYACSHEVCWDCLCSAIDVSLSSNGNTVRCPCCPFAVAADDVQASGSAEIQCIPVKAFGFIDPFLFGQALKSHGTDKRTPKQALICERFVRSGQMEPFISVEMSDKPPVKCPFCDSWAIGRVGGDLVARCPNASCASLFCAQCKSAAHVGHTCEEAMGVARAKMDEKSEEYMRKVSKECPGCGAQITHFRDHGCHHIKCGNCHAEFCYNCLKPYGSGESRCTCPIFCNERCQCLACDECRTHKSCHTCSGRCPVCRGESVPGVY